MIFQLILAFLLLGSAVALGLVFLRFLPIRFRLPEYLACGCVLGLLAASWAPLLAVLVVGYRWGLPLAIVVLTASTGAGWRIRARWRARISPMRTRRDLVAWLVVSLATGALLFQRFVSQMLASRDGAYFCATNTWGDLALHLSLLTRFSYQQHFTWDFPIFSSGTLSYPFLLDFLSGVLHRLGWPLQPALIVPGFALALSLLQIVYFTAYRWFRSSLAGALAILLFLASGAPAGILSFWREFHASGKPLLQFLGAMDKMYGHIPDQGLHFSNVVTDYLLPQRSILFGLPVFLLLSVLLAEAWRRPRHARSLLLAAGILAGSLPFAHVHGFFTVMGLWAWLALIQSDRLRTHRNAWFLGWLLALAIAAPQIAWQFHSSYTGHFSHWQLWWLKPENEGPLLFWVRNVGVALPLGAALLAWLWWRRRSHGFHFHYFFALAALFAITNVYQFQPNMFDNMKFMVFSYLVLSIYLGYLFSRWAVKSWVGGIAALACVLSLTLAGALSIVYDTKVSWLFSSREDIAAAAVVRREIPPEARVLTSDQHNHFLPTLTGRRIVMGYRGWLWSYGVGYGKVERDVGAMFAGGDEAVRLLREYDVSYVCLGPSERDQMHANVDFFQNRYPPVVESGPYTIYYVRSRTP